MEAMFHPRVIQAQVLKRFRILSRRPVCSKPNKNNDSDMNKPAVKTINGSGEVESNLSNYDESYRLLDKLDFMTAAKILFTDQPKKKKFGLDFHLVQLFFACLPSLAVYLVAQYSRYEMRRMEAELEQKKEKEEEEKLKEQNKELESRAMENKEAAVDPEILEVKERLDKLEETLNEIVVKSKKLSENSQNNKQENDIKRKHVASTEPNNVNSVSETEKSAEKNCLQTSKEQGARSKQQTTLGEGSSKN